MSIVSLRKLLEDNEDYPPSEMLWRQIINLTKKQTKASEFQSIQSRIIHEVDSYRPPLPEPNLARVFFQGEYFFIDAKDNIYRPDPANPLVGNQVGQIAGGTDENGIPILEVTIDKKVVCRIPSIKVQAIEIHHNHYYQDKTKNIFRGLHPQKKYVYQIGKLNDEGKVALI